MWSKFITMPSSQCEHLTGHQKRLNSVSSCTKLSVWELLLRKPLVTRLWNSNCRIDLLQAHVDTKKTTCFSCWKFEMLQILQFATDISKSSLPRDHPHWMVSTLVQIDHLFLFFLQTLARQPGCHGAAATCDLVSLTLARTGWHFLT